MGMLASLLGATLAGPLLGVGWVARRIAEAAEQEHANPARIERTLLELGAALEAGEIDEATHDAREAELLEELAALQAPADEDPEAAP
jgi:hypothetical protein